MYVKFPAASLNTGTVTNLPKSSSTVLKICPSVLIKVPSLLEKGNVAPAASNIASLGDISDMSPIWLSDSCDTGVSRLATWSAGS